MIHVAGGLGICRQMLEISQNGNGLWTVFGPGLIVTDLTKELAEAFVEAYGRVHQAVAS